MSTHVMFVIGGLERGGAENQLVSLANGLADRGWRVTVLSYMPFSETSLRSELRNERVRAVTLDSSGGGLSRYAKLIGAASEIRRSKPDALVGFMFHGMMTVRLLGSLLRVPARVSSVRTGWDGRPREFVLRLTDRLTDVVTAQSAQLAAEFCRRRVTTPARTRVIPNSVDVNRFRADAERERARAELGIDAGQFLWLAAGRLSGEKDYPNMLKAFSEVARRRDDAALTIAGTGPLEREIRSMVERMGLSARVSTLGLRQDVPTLFAASDAFILSSAWEGMPVAALEAMAARKPVVATSVGAVPEIITDGKTGFVAPPGDSAALADAMTRLMNLSPRSRAAMTERAYERVISEFSPDSVLDRWEALFDQLLNDGAGR